MDGGDKGSDIGDRRDRAPPLDVRAPEAAASSSRGAWLAWIGRQLAQLIACVAILGAAVSGANYLVATKPTTPQSAVQEPIYTVETVTLDVGRLRPEISAFGEVEARRAVELRALVDGEIVYAHPNLVVGERVAAGDELVRIDAFAYEGAVLEADANLAEAEARLVETRAQLESGEVERAAAEEQLELAVRDLDRATELRERNVTNERALDDRRLTLSQRRQTVDMATTSLSTLSARVSQQEAAVRRLKWRVDEARRDLADTALKAPFDAIVRREFAEPGRRVGVNDVIAELYEANAFDVRFTLSNDAFGRLQAAEREMGEALIGKEGRLEWRVGDATNVARFVVERLGADVRAELGGVEVLARIALDDAAAVRPGAFVEVSLPDRAFENAVAAPETALYGGGHVFVVVDGRLARRDVAVLAWRGDVVFLRGDLDGAELLVTRLAEAGDGVRVRSATAPRAQADAAAETPPT